MSSKLLERYPLAVTAFHGGSRGPCVQLTALRADGVSALTLPEVRELRDVLSQWLEEHSEAEPAFHTEGE